MMNKIRKKQIVATVLVAIDICGSFFVLTHYQINAMGTYFALRNSFARNYNEPNDEKDLADWQKINPDTLALLKIDERTFPIVQSRDNEKYLKLSIIEKADILGTPFLDAEINADDCDNLIIYGHSTYDEEMMFSFIKAYFKKGDQVKHTYTYIDQKGEHRFAELAVRIINADLNASRSWYRFKFADDAAKIAYINGFIAESTMIYNETFSLGARLMTLVTCNMDDTNQRYLLLLQEI